jgi:hypothetical protein
MIVTLEQLTQLVQERRPQAKVEFRPKAGHPALSGPRPMVIIDAGQLRVLIYHDDACRFTVELVHRLPGGIHPAEACHPDQEEPQFSEWLLAKLDQHEE